tara:strand:- start:26990 stop:27742 length:753 start_codon:yes stop_codon:yes gene_type:complete
MDWNAGQKGYVPRDWQSYPEFCSHSQYSGKIYPRKDWVELIELQRKNLTAPVHVHQYNKVPVLNQGRYGYCWMYGTVACILNRYAAQGIDPVPNLNAHATAAMGKRYRNQGGFGIEATKYIQKYGIPEFDVWPQFSNDRSLEKDPKVIESCKQHKLVDFEEMPRNSFDSVMSCLICPVDPSPCTLAFDWWRHLVAGMYATYRGSGNNIEWGIGFVNSWKNWGDNGFGVVWNKKAVAFESVAVRSVKAVRE